MNENVNISLKILAAIAIMLGVYYVGYEGIIEPNQQGHSFNSGDKLDLALGTVFLFLGCLGLVVGFIYEEVKEFKKSFNTLTPEILRELDRKWEYNKKVLKKSN